MPTPKANFWYAGFIDPHTQNASETPQAIFAGLKRLGYAVTQHAPSTYRGTPDADINIIYGMRGNGGQIVADGLRRGIPSIVIDLGFLRRAMKINGYQGYWQVSLNGLNWLPGSADSDRFEKLEIPYPKRARRTGYVLIAEQTPYDASHGMDDFQLAEWTRQAIEKCEALGLEYKVRRHPMNKRGPASLLPTTTIEEDLAGASCVYIHNSNVGNDALLAGVPVICDEDSLHLPTYHGIVGHDLTESPKFPTAKVMKDYLHRLAYAQWTQDEIANGEAFEYVLSQIPAHV